MDVFLERLVHIHEYFIVLSINHIVHMLIVVILYIIFPVY